MEAFIK